MDYSKKLKDPRWQRLRLEIMERDGFRCTRCRDDKSTLHVNHLKYTGDPWEAPREHLETLCESCHKRRTDLNSRLQLTKTVDILAPCTSTKAPGDPYVRLPYDGSADGVICNIRHLFYTNANLTHEGMTRGLAEILGIAFDRNKYLKGRP